MNEEQYINPIQMGLEILVAGVRRLALEASYADMWRSVADCYAIGDPQADERYKEAVRATEEGSDGEDQS